MNVDVEHHAYFNIIVALALILHSGAKAVTLYLIGRCTQAMYINA